MVLPGDVDDDNNEDESSFGAGCKLPAEDGGGEEEGFVGAGTTLFEGDVEIGVAVGEGVPSGGVGVSGEHSTSRLRPGQTFGLPW